MLNKFRYLFVKIFIVFIRKLPLFKTQGCTLVHRQYKNKNIEKSFKIAVAFLDGRLTHIGDQLFFDPLIQNLSSYFDHVDIVPTKPMSEYFRLFGHNVLTCEVFDAQNYDLIITRIEEFWNFKKYLSQTIFINTVEKSLKNRITSEIVKSVYQVLKIPLYNDALKPRIPNASEKKEVTTTVKQTLSQHQQYLIYSNYVDSGWFRVKKKDRDILEKSALKLAKEHNLTIVHVGTSQDKKNDPHFICYDNYIDLRGKTSIVDLFCLCHLENIKICVTFDTFVFHVASLTNTKSYVRMKKSSSVKMNYLLRCIVPCVNSNSILIELLK